jgi:hypothetical protein
MTVRKNQVRFGRQIQEALEKGLFSAFNLPARSGGASFGLRLIKSLVAKLHVDVITLDRSIDPEPVFDEKSSGLYVCRKRGGGN